MFILKHTAQLTKVFYKVRTYQRLGLYNLFCVFLYRTALRFQIFQKLMNAPLCEASFDPLFEISDLAGLKDTRSTLLTEEADTLVEGMFSCFSYHSHFYGIPPDWFLNPFKQTHFNAEGSHWSTISDFADNAGDIKCIWEISRFDWILTLVCAFIQTGKQSYLLTANNWVADWNNKNPLQRGVNWKCGQEASRRVMQVLLASLFLGQHVKPTEALIRFVVDHAERISPTIYYAMAQDNNHGTSEAAALFVIGSWLLAQETQSDHVKAKKARRWQKQGRKWLENRMARLVEDDGSFSQYSVNYHRVLLDTVCYVEYWRNLLGEQPFSDLFYLKARAATRWLYVFTNRENGDAPNIGANDGARLFNLSTASYRDYRPSVQLASRLFMQKPAYPQGKYDQVLEWLKLSFSQSDYSWLSMEKKSRLFNGGGYGYLTRGKVEVFIRYPVFKFRPGHADALHVDLWYGCVNVIRDAGTYSYNTSARWMNYFPGTRAHSTVEFDGHDQMVRVGRFLFGNWLQVNHVSSIQTTAEGVTWSVGYKDSTGAEHRRELFVSDHTIIIKDQVKGFKKKAIVRWRLHPVKWILKQCTCISDIATIQISSTRPISSIKIGTGYESRHYQEKSSLPVLIIEVNEECEVLTQITLQKRDVSIKEI